MFGPTKTWRKWQKKINQKQRRYATACAIAASGKLSLVQARGHRTEGLASFPVVVSTLGDAKNTGGARDQLVKLGLGATAAQGDEPAPNSDELARAATRQNKPGKGKLRGRRHKKKRGPLIVFSDLESGEAAAAEAAVQLNYRNLPGVDLCQVSALNLLQLAPGGTFGRLIVWTAPAFKALQDLFGSHTSASKLKKGYHLMRPMMTNADISRIINSDEVQSAVQPAKQAAMKLPLRANALKNRSVMAKLNPGAQQRLKLRELAMKEGSKERKALLEKKRATVSDAKKHHKGAKEFYKNMMAAYEVKADEPEDNED